MMTFEQIGIELGISRQAVHMTYQRAMDKVRAGVLSDPAVIDSLYALLEEQEQPNPDLEELLRWIEEQELEEERDGYGYDDLQESPDPRYIQLPTDYNFGCGDYQSGQGEFPEYEE